MRWLRPDFQDPAQREQQTEMLLNKERFTQQESALEHDLASKIDATATPAPTRTPATAQHWPNTLPEQIKAVAEVLAGATTPLTQSRSKPPSKAVATGKKACRRCSKHSKRWAGRSAATTPTVKPSGADLHP